MFSAGLGEFKLRDLNDEINKLLREKGHWEERIVELGGPDYKVQCFAVGASVVVVVVFRPALRPDITAMVDWA